MKSVSDYLQLAPHVMLLIVLASAEGFRLTEFYRLLTGSTGSAIASATLTVVIVTYLALYNLRKASTFAMLVCILLSLGSFLEPWKELRESSSERTIEQAEARKLPVPVWDERKYWFGGGETYRKAYETELKRVQEHNARIDEMLFSEEEEQLDVFKYIIFALGVLVMAVCVPLLAYVVSHRLADELKRIGSKPAPARTAGNLALVNKKKIAWRKKQ